MTWWLVCVCQLLAWWLWCHILLAWWLWCHILAWCLWCSSKNYRWNNKLTRLAKTGNRKYRILYTRKAAIFNDENQTWWISCRVQIISDDSKHTEHSVSLSLTHTHTAIGFLSVRDDLASRWRLCGLQNKQTDKTAQPYSLSKIDKNKPPIIHWRAEFDVKTITRGVLFV